MTTQKLDGEKSPLRTGQKRSSKEAASFVFILLPFCRGKGRKRGERGRAGVCLGHNNNNSTRHTWAWEGIELLFPL